MSTSNDASPDTVYVPRRKKLAAIQSSYIPWKGYFDLLNRADEFVLYDDVQYTRYDWRHRNRVKTKDGIKWLSIPVQFKLGSQQRISDTIVCNQRWRRKHWTTLVHTFSRAPYFSYYRDLLESLYLDDDQVYLSRINHRFLIAICQCLGITTPIRWAMDYQLGTGRNERIIEMCQKACAEEFILGPAAKSYIDPRLFAEAGIKLTWMDYSGYPEYPQFHPPFEHQVTILDMLFHLGPEAPDYIWGLRRKGASGPVSW